MLKKASPSRIIFQSLPLGLLTIGIGYAVTPYQFGNPTAAEQSYIELINRARAAPAAEGARLAATTDPDVLFAYSYFSVNLATMQSEFNAIPAAQPLAPNASLTTASRSHSQWMLANATQSHDETNPSNDTQTRIEAAGYDWWYYGENISFQVQSVWYGHAGFEVDWGVGLGGMQSGRGHRQSIHYANFHEIGVGIANGTNGAAGPQQVTQDFGEPFDEQTFGTGVAYYDLNSNNFYDIGEGIAGLTTNISGIADFCTTAIGGGWAVPIPNTATTRTVTFSGLGISQTRSLIVPASTNAKVDLKLTYAAPTITSAAPTAPGAVHTLAFTAVGGASGYKWNRWISSAAPAENCNALTNVTVATTTAYAVLNTNVKQEGSASFHLANPGGAAGNQIVELNSLFHGLASPSLAFQSRLRTSTASEHHKVQVKEEGSTIWQDVSNQDGGTAETSFSAKTVSLTSMAGKEFRVRFLLNFTSGSTYANTGDTFGWFIDAISFTNITALSSNVSQTLSGTSGTFTPTAGSYLMSVAPVISGIEFPNTDQIFTISAPAPTFATWASSFESANGLTAGTIANNPNADQDKDGRTNLVEYAFGTSPVSGNEAAPRMPTLQASASHCVVRYIRDTTLADLTLVPVASSDFATWKSPGQPGAPAGFTDSIVSTAGNLETREAKIPLGSGGRWFLRVQVNKP
ncbi:MAG: CAP domain-containing protein [Luteolibacter sp.]|uniref:CAP domain-containing protein n=1 Tax=Luteolibacter sp. TaxID=1962973 RepID=UPI0032657C15